MVLMKLILGMLLLLQSLDQLKFASQSLTSPQLLTISFRANAVKVTFVVILSIENSKIRMLKDIINPFVRWETNGALVALGTNGLIW